MAWTRRQFLTRGTLLAGSLVAADGFLVEPRWVEVTSLDMSHLGIGKTIVQLTDTHYRGDRARFESIIQLTREQKPDYVFFTGDLVDSMSGEYLAEALTLLTSVGVPVYGVIGNHDPLDRKSMQLFRSAAAATGGAWLVGESKDLGSFLLDGSGWATGVSQTTGKPRILLCHYPIVGDQWKGKPYDLILCGHSHGGQCRIPGIGPLFLPRGVGRFVAGLYDSPAGKLYVSRGLGTTAIPIRFACRPELTVIRV